MFVLFIMLFIICFLFFIGYYIRIVELISECQINIETKKEFWLIMIPYGYFLLKIINYYKDLEC